MRLPTHIGTDSASGNGLRNRDAGSRRPFAANYWSIMNVTDLCQPSQRTNQMIVPMTRSLVIFTFKIQNDSFMVDRWLELALIPYFFFSVFAGSQSTARDCVKGLFSLKDSNFHHPLAERELTLCFVLVMEHTLPLIYHSGFQELSSGHTRHQEFESKPSSGEMHVFVDCRVPLLCCPVWCNASFMSIDLLIPSKTIPKSAESPSAARLLTLFFFLVMVPQSWCV